MTFELAPAVSGSKAELYQALATQAESLLADERDYIANAANVSALIYYSLPKLNWAGFYFDRGAGLVLGPFQGKPACVRIPFGKGVCGTAARLQKTLVVPNVHEFPGHIACDSDSQSEIVVPIINEDRFIGVLDLDSPELARFDDEDARGLNLLIEIYAKRTDWKGEMR